ncbi:MAG TPA: allantoate amidohydrolase [Terriglobales bacterium]|nr:allantoate amidohydrolase [Terriglobales bacterium]
MHSSRDQTDCATEVIARCQALARFTEDAGSIRRTFLSPPMRECHREIARWVAPLGATSRVDAAGNLRMLYPAAKPDAPCLQRLLIASHLDTVPNAGAYDGVLGVVLPIALLGALNGRKFPFAIEVVGFSEEEGVRFGTPFIGSRALVGSLDDLLSRQDAQGISIRKAIADFGLNPAEIAQAAIGDDVFGYVEFHIEQGPVLENVGRPLGVVEAIAGQSRLEFTFVGHANHAGTTPMNLRHDALAAAAEWVGAVEQRAQTTSGLVATVGAIQAKPGATNVIAGETRVTLDVRHQSDQVRSTAVDYFTRQAEDIAKRRGLSVRSNVLLNQRAVPMDPFLVGQVEQAVSSAGCEPYRMASGAGHDAMILAEKVPAVMIFLRTPGGISHDPAESVEVGDVAKAIDCGLHLLDQLASSSQFQRKTQHA